MACVRAPVCVSFNVMGLGPGTEKPPLVSPFLSGLYYTKLSASPTSLTYLLGCDFNRIAICFSFFSTFSQIWQSSYSIYLLLKRQAAGRLLNSVLNRLKGLSKIYREITELRSGSQFGNVFLWVQKDLHFLLVYNHQLKNIFKQATTSLRSRELFTTVLAVLLTTKSPTAHLKQTLKKASESNISSVFY